MKRSYPLESLETLICSTLNPLQNLDVSNIIEQKQELYNLVLQEKVKIQSAITRQVFKLSDEAKISCTINNYHCVLMVLLDKALKNKTRIQHPTWLNLLDEAISGIDNLLYFIKSRFIIYLDKQVRAPVAYVVIIRERLNARLEKIIRKSRQHKNFLPVLSIIRMELKSFFNFSANKCSLNFRSIFYVKELISELENLELSEDEEIYTKLDQLLIRMNFNSRLYVKHLKQKIMSLIKMSIATQEEKEEWLFYKKHFHQFYQRTDTVFVANDADLKLQLDNWFLRKIFYIEKEIPSSISSDIGKTLPSKEKSQKQQKLRTKLSVDQMALILRAADDQRIVIAKSLSSIFKNIAPYLSTPYREDISFESMRSKSYYPETRDKEIAIQTLREIIDKIREY